MSFDDFWLAYLSQHRRSGTRICHYVGTTVGLVGGAALLLLGEYLLAILIAVLGYGLAIGGHFLVEKNKPYATKPIWGFYADLRMLKRALTGELEADLKRVDALRASIDHRPSP